MQCYLLLYYSSSNLVLNAQEAGNVISRDNLLKNSTDAGSLDILLEPIPYPVTVNSESIRFELTFLKPNTSQIQDHVDFNVRRLLLVLGINWN